MKKITKQEAEKLLKKTNNSIDSINTSIKPSVFYQTTLNKKEFYSLIIGYHKNYDIITKKKWKILKSTTTLKECLTILFNKNLSFNKLSKGTPKGTYTPSWFEKCAQICQNTKPDQIGYLITSNPNKQEKKECPKSNFRLIDGTHRALSLIYLIETQKYPFTPLKTIHVSF